MRCEYLDKTYNHGKPNECQALKDISLNFKNKGLVCILGKSGSGKSTLLSILGYLDQPSNGKVYDGDICLSDLNSNQANSYRRNNVGYIFQNYNLINELTVEENITIGLKEIDQNKLKNILELLGIIKFVDKIASELSGGEQQRVAIARALLKESKVIIADEPTGNLDNNNSKIIFNTLREISKERLVIVVTHDNENAFEYADRVITIFDGEVVDDTTPNCDEEPLGCKIYSDNQTIISSKTAMKISWKLIKAKKIRLIISICLLAVSLSLFGLFILFMQYDLIKVSPDTFQSNNQSMLKIQKGYTDVNTDKFILSNRTILENELTDLCKRNDVFNLDITYMIFGMMITSSSTGNYFLPQNVYEATVSSAERLSKYGFQLEYGSYPDIGEEVAITDFLVYSIGILRPELINNLLGINSISELSDDELLIERLKKLKEDKLIALFGQNWNEYIKEPSNLEKIRENFGILLLDEKVNFGANEFIISAIIKTDFVKKYKDLVYMDDVAINNDDRAKTFKYLVNNYYSQFYVNDSFLSEVYMDKIVFTNTVFIKYSSVKNLVNSEKELQGTDAYATTNFFRNCFKQEFDKNKIGSYTMENTITRPLGSNMEPDLIFTSEPINFIGIFELPANLAEKINNGSAIIVSDEYFNKFSKSQCYIASVNIDLPQSKEKQIELMKYLEENDLYYVTNYSEPLYELSNIIKIFSKTFLALLVVLLLFSIFYISSFFQSIIGSQKREIGIMRAIGLKSIEISKIFLIAGIMISLCAICLSYILLTLLQIIANDLIINEFFNYIDNMKILGLKILTLNYIPFLIIILICIIISILSMVLPIKKLSKMNPSDVMRR